MNDDYLWDKTGEPDPQVKKLEEILGTLRYQPKPLELPKDLPQPRKRNYFPWLAIAASLLLAILAGAFWLSTRTRNEAPPREARVLAPSPIEEKKSSTVEPKIPELKPALHNDAIAVHKSHRRSVTPVLSKQEREEALVAKEQLMLALRLATEKLSLVHKKTQNTNPANQIRNQHRVG